MSPAPRPANSLFSLLARIEEAVLGIFLVAMILLACLQVLLRTLYSSGIPWADTLLRYLVLWSGLLGAAMATSRGKHISMDIMSFLIPPSRRIWLKAATNLFSAIVAGFLTWAAYLFIRNESTFSNTELLSIPSWIWNLIFPLAFAAISLRFFLASWTAIRTISSEKGPGRQ
jgi:TRAP-type C4-dicarboxylate transport system permease small subunit